MPTVGGRLTRGWSSVATPSGWTAPAFGTVDGLQFPRVGSPRNQCRFNAATKCQFQSEEEPRRGGGSCTIDRCSWRDSALNTARRAAQERPAAAQIEECQCFIKRSQTRLRRLEEERAAEQCQPDAAVARLNRLKEEIARIDPPPQPQVSPVPTTVPEPMAEVHQLKSRVAELESEREEWRKKRTRSLSVPSADMPGQRVQDGSFDQSGKYHGVEFQPVQTPSSRGCTVVNERRMVFGVSASGRRTIQALQQSRPIT